MAERYPEIEPYEHGMLDVGDGNLVYWEACGNPDGKPAVVLHGGPGSGSTPGARRNFDPAAYRIVLFDQRNCGRSTATRERPDDQPCRQHHPAPDRRHRVAARAPRDRPLAGARRLLGRDARARLRRGASRAGQRDCPGRCHQQHQGRDRLALPRCRPVLPRGLGHLSSGPARPGPARQPRSPAITGCWKAPTRRCASRLRTTGAPGRTPSACTRRDGCRHRGTRTWSGGRPSPGS